MDIAYCFSLVLGLFILGIIAIYISVILVETKIAYTIVRQVYELTPITKQKNSVNTVLISTKFSL